jgi:nucleoid-associated protein YgaU
VGILTRLFGGKPEPVRAAPELRYRVGLNETCRSLAERFYGNEVRWEQIYAANERTLRSEVQIGTDPLPPGVEIAIPSPQFGLDGQPFQNPVAS